MGQLIGIVTQHQEKIRPAIARYVKLTRSCFYVRASWLHNDRKLMREIYEVVFSRHPSKYLKTDGIVSQIEKKLKNHRNKAEFIIDNVQALDLVTLRSFLNRFAILYPHCKRFLLIVDNRGAEAIASKSSVSGFHSSYGKFHCWYYL